MPKGVPSKGTPKDRRLKANRPKTGQGSRGGRRPSRGKKG
jgi:hypothetical protein